MSKLTRDELIKWASKRVQYVSNESLYPPNKDVADNEDVEVIPFEDFVSIIHRMSIGVIRLDEVEDRIIEEQQGFANAKDIIKREIEDAEKGIKIAWENINKEESFESNKMFLEYGASQENLLTTLKRIMAELDSKSDEQSN